MWLKGEVEQRSIGTAIGYNSSEKPDNAAEDDIAWKVGLRCILVEVGIGIGRQTRASYNHPESVDASIRVQL